MHPSAVALEARVGYTIHRMFDLGKASQLEFQIGPIEIVKIATGPIHGEPVPPRNYFGTLARFLSIIHNDDDRAVCARVFYVHLYYVKLLRRFIHKIPMTLILTYGTT